ncbi:hypothetical protein [Streptomyces boluensis]|uniref:Uncharacterized protein n=1 Tax=Streptomyces boluensis TaxID=1775135 RepID=A0A964XIV2_9ACTN|nr:hypothetical protein [Streptomyces boluensis]NBE50634.1 hypothetical protein [Streptomyces boluensis]
MAPRRRRGEGALPLSEHYGDLVRVALMEARPAGLQTKQLVAATRLSPSQVARRVRHLRDVGAAEHLTPIIWRRKDGYLFSDEPADWIAYEKQQFRLLLGRLTRMITGTLDPHLARYPDDEWAQLASAQLTGVRATLSQLSK